MPVASWNSNVYGSLGEKWEYIKDKVRFDWCLFSWSDILLTALADDWYDPSREKLENDVASNQ